jgi:hypothetical protein
MSTYDITDGLAKKYRHQIDHQKVCIVWDTDLGASEEALVDAYIAAHGLNTAYKYGVDLSVAANTDRQLLWDAWLSDLADYIETNQIQAICCSPNCPLTQDFISSGNVSLTAFSTLLSSALSIKKILQIESITIATLLTGHTFDQAVKNLAVKTLDNQEDILYTHNLGLARDDLPINGLDFNIDGIDDVDFKYLNYKVPELWSTDFNSVQGLTGIKPRNPHNNAAILKIPSWRIGWKASGLMPSPTAQEITDMVARGKLASAMTFDEHKTQSTITMTLRDRTNDGHCGKGVALGKVLDSIGYTNYNYGFRLEYSQTLANIAAVDDPSLAHFKRLYPISAQTDPRFVSTNSEVGIADPDPVNSSTVRYYDDVATIGGQKGQRFDAYNGTTFPLECFIHFSLFGNFKTDNNLEFYNSASPSSQTINVKDGGCVIELTSHGHKISPMALRHGASAAFCSYREPSGFSAIMKAERFMFSLLRGNSYGVAAMRTQYDWTDEHELWGDGLATPYKTQSEYITGNESMNNVKFELVAIKGSADMTGSFPAITVAGTGHSVDDIITFNGQAFGSPAAGIKIKVTSVDGSGGITAYSWVSGGIGWSDSDVADQSSTSGSGVNARLTLGASVISATPLAFGFFSDPLTTQIAVDPDTLSAKLYNSAGVEFAFSQFNPDIPDLHGLISNPASNQFGRPAGITLWVEGDLAEYPYGDNAIIYVNGTAYPFLKSYIADGSAVWSSSAFTAVDGFSRLEWKISGATNPAPLCVEGDKIGMSLKVPERKRLIKRGYLNA